MAWIESHQALEQHPKLFDLCHKTEWNVDEAIGKLHRLWWWTLTYAEDGDLTKYKPSQYLLRLDEKLDPEKLYDILVETTFIDECGKLHDWLDYSGRYLTGKYRTSNPKKLASINSKYAGHKLKEEPESPPRVKSERKIFIKPKYEDVLKYMQDKGLDQFGAEKLAHKYMNHYEAKDWFIGKNKMKNWQAAVRTWLSNNENGAKDKTHERRTKVTKDLRSIDYSK